MKQGSSFTELIERVRSGDEQAATQLVQDFEPVVRRELRFRLRDSLARRELDSMDISQSVLSNFFVRAAMRQYDLNEPVDLVKLLATMTRNKVAESCAASIANGGTAVERYLVWRAWRWQALIRRPAECWRAKKSFSWFAKASARKNVDSWTCAARGKAGKRSLAPLGAVQMRGGNRWRARSTRSFISWDSRSIEGRSSGAAVSDELFRSSTKLSDCSMNSRESFISQR